MTEDNRQGRIAAIFRLLDEVTADAADERIALCREALGLMTPDEAASDAAGWLEFEAGKAYFGRLSGADRVAELTAAIGAFTRALAIWTPASQPVNWPSAQGNLGVCYSDRQLLTGSVADEHAALEAFRAALRVLDLQRAPALWAQITSGLGVHHLQRSEGNRAEVIEEAVKCLDQATQVQATLGLTADCSLTLANLGMAYRERANGDREENLERSLAYLDAAMDGLSSQGGNGSALDRARVLLHRSETLRYRVAGTWADNIERAYADIQRAAGLISPGQAPIAWAETQAELGHVLRGRAAGSRAENQERAIEAYRRALTHYNQVETPLRWALIGVHIASSLSEQVSGDRVINLEEALDQLLGAVEVLRAVPGTMVYGAALAQLGAVYLRRRRGSAADNARTAWRYLTEALDVAERSELPPRTRAAILNSLGNAAMAQEADDWEQQVEDAIGCYERGLELAGSEEGRLQARLLSNLAAAYAQRRRGERAGNIARSLELYARVSVFRTRQQAPLEWAEMRCNVGIVLAESGEPERRAEAAAAFREALEVLKAQEVFEARAEVLGQGTPSVSVVTAGRNLGHLGALEGRWQDAVDGYKAALDATDARYRQSIRLEARFVELTEAAGLSAELAVALAMQAVAAEGAPRDVAAQDGDGSRHGADTSALLRRAAAALEAGRMRLLGDLMERDAARLDRLREQRQDLHAAYIASAGRLRGLEAAQWTSFQPTTGIDLRAA